MNEEEPYETRKSTFSSFHRSVFGSSFCFWFPFVIDSNTKLNIKVYRVCIHRKRKTHFIADYKLPNSTRIFSPSVDGHERPVDEAVVGTIVFARLQNLRPRSCTTVKKSRPHLFIEYDECEWLTIELRRRNPHRMAKRDRFPKRPEQDTAIKKRKRIRWDGSCWLRVFPCCRAWLRS